jgi:hypothetical protein
MYPFRENVDWIRILEERSFLYFEYDLRNK